MRVVIQNLLENAIKYTPEDGTIEVTVKKVSDAIMFSVGDSGIGIPKESQKKIFNRFFRAPNAVHEETDGSGLGLYIVENIVRRHHGTITFTSTEKEGTIFYVTLPIAQPS